MRPNNTLFYAVVTTTTIRLRFGTVRLDPSAVADSRIIRRIFVRRKSAEKKIPASRNRRQKYSAEYQPEKKSAGPRLVTDVMMTSDMLLSD